MDHDKLNELQQSAHALAALTTAASTLTHTGVVMKAHDELAKLCQAMGEELVNAHKTAVVMGGADEDALARAAVASAIDRLTPRN